MDCTMVHTMYLVKKILLILIFVLSSDATAYSSAQASQGIIALLDLDIEHPAHHLLHRLVNVLAHQLPDDLAYEVGGQLPHHVGPVTPLSLLLLLSLAAKCSFLQFECIDGTDKTGN